MSAVQRPTAQSRAELRGRERPNARLALTITEACEALGISWPTWREHVMPEVKVVRRGRVKLVAVAELERWLSENGERVGGGS
jgi:hypothetical protein